jgi:hypothetical protein
MDVSRLEKMTKGWFVGNFSPTLYLTESVEVAVKKYSAGAKEDWHYHKIASEITVIISGEVKMNGAIYLEGDIIIMRPGEGTDFTALRDTVTTVVKIPGVLNDKYLK